jgi:serine protease Do
MKLASSSIEGMGFAIPIETAIEMADQLMLGKDIERPYIGVEIGLARESYYSEETYVYINKVEKNSPAAKAGLKSGDIILKVNDVETPTIVKFQHELYKYKIGESVKITIERDGEERTLIIKLGTKNKEA